MVEQWPALSPYGKMATDLIPGCGLKSVDFV